MTESTKPELFSRRGDGSSYLVCGISFHDSPVDLREVVAIRPEEIPASIRFLMDQPGVHECMVLSTCNRTELFLSVEDWVDGAELFRGLIRRIHGSEPERLAHHLRVRRGEEAIEHLFRVASSLDSQVLGEPQILGQTRAAFRAAESAGSVDKDLHRWISHALATAKSVRSKTAICDSAVSVSSAAVELAEKVFESLSGKEIVILGAGKMSELAALRMRKSGARSIVIANRTLSKANDLARKCCGSVVPFSRRDQPLANADVVVCSTRAPGYVLDEPTIRRILRSRSSRPLLLLDLSMPRNIDPRAGSIEGVYLFNLDDLETIVEKNRHARKAEAGRAEKIVRNNVKRFLRDERNARLAPAIAAMRRQVQSICNEELARLESRVRNLSHDERAELEVMLHRISQKIIHPAIMELKSMDVESEDQFRFASLMKLFGIPGKSLGY